MAFSLLFHSGTTVSIVSILNSVLEKNADGGSATMKLMYTTFGVRKKKSKCLLRPEEYLRSTLRGTRRRLLFHSKCTTTFTSESRSTESRWWPPRRSTALSVVSLVSFRYRLFNAVENAVVISRTALLLASYRSVRIARTNSQTVVIQMNVLVVPLCVAWSVNTACVHGRGVPSVLLR